MMKLADPCAEEIAGLAALEFRLGRLHVCHRLGLERDHEPHELRKGTRFDGWYSRHGLIRGSLQLAGLYARGQRNALAIELRRHEIPIPQLPEAFDGFTLLQLSDLHFDMKPEFIGALIESIRPLHYDLCVLTGDYRASTFGPHDAALADLKQLRPHIGSAAYAVLGNHDTIRMVPAMERMATGCCSAGAARTRALNRGGPSKPLRALVRGRAMACSRRAKDDAAAIINLARAPRAQVLNANRERSVLVSASASEPESI